MFRFIRQNTILTLIVAGILLALLSLVVVLISSIQPPPAQVAQGIPESRPAPLIWQIQGSIFSMEAHSVEGKIQIKILLLATLLSSFFYAMKLTSPAGSSNNYANPLEPVITATSTLPGCDGKNHSPIPLTTQVQPLGSLGDFKVGVVHILGWTDA